MVILASSFHYSAITFIILPLFSNQRWSLIRGGILFITMVGAIVMSKPLIGLTSDYYVYAKDEVTGGLYSFGQIFLFILCLVLIRLYGKPDLTTLKINYSYWVLTIYMAIVFSAKWLPVAARLAVYFSIPMIYLLPNVMKSKLRIKSIVVLSFVFLVFLVYHTVIFKYRPEWGGFYPYRFMEI